MDKEQLLSTISKFLETKVERTGSGWPDVSEEDFSTLRLIVDELIELKWETDCDNCRPVIPLINDITKFESLHYSPVPRDTYSDDEKQLTKEEYFNRFRRLKSNADFANDALSREIEKITILSRFERITKDK